MDISSVSNSSSYDDWKLIQAQREKEQKNAEQTGAASGAQVTAVENTTSSLSQSEKVLNITNTDTVEISNEGRAYQQKMQAEANAGAERRTDGAEAEKAAEKYKNGTSLYLDEE